jgi:POT family proton-dependent oligopeptide transporter
MLLVAMSFAAAYTLQLRIDEAGDGQVHVAWQAIQYLLLTLGECLTSITCLEFAFTQAPTSLKAFGN